MRSQHCGNLGTFGIFAPMTNRMAMTRTCGKSKGRKRVHIQPKQWGTVPLVLALLIVIPGTVNAELSIFSLFRGSGTDVHEHECPNCGHTHKTGTDCIKRTPLKECVVAKKKVFDSSIRYEYVSIPETRYRFKKRLITKEVPCKYCKPTCKTEKIDNCVGEEKWDKHESPCGCGELHCKHIEPKIEKLPCKVCGREEGETVATAHYWSCVKEPYTVYRRVKRPVCVKEPRYEKVTIQVTRHVCQDCGGAGCTHCAAANDCDECSGDGCSSCDE